ncbi:hypothetical protein KOI40_13880 [Aestuariicella sp. G3-2]|uniref:hypothetical protein n=1 Tax=Pseudomaricurvus albidus TaxID=2842452 RepID=UPI001C0B3B0A|nr:hypothetical protein [Aestuariicella albida]MBU3070910.1 hypothetical protein [Aestuariicella albida]
MNHNHSSLLAALLLSLSYALPAQYVHAESDLMIIEDDGSEELMIEDDSETLSIDDGSGDSLSIDDDGLNLGDDLMIDESQPGEPNQNLSETLQNYSSTSQQGVNVSLDKLWFEYGRYESDSPAEYQLYGHGKGTINWQGEKWELQASARLDYYEEHSDDSSDKAVPANALSNNKGNWDKTKLDYDETFVRYRGNRGILTVGAQKVIWGRIDEVPPSDRLSTQDLRRGLQDDLEDRRLASAAVRYEHFIGDGKLDLLYIPRLRETELPDENSVWYPINQREGTILGLDTSPLIEYVVRNTPIDDDAPNTDGGFGIRFNQLGSGFDYALGIQHGISTLPYFTYSTNRNVIEARYLRSTTVSGDIGFEALGGTVKMEAAWNSDTPITRTDGRFDSVESLAWGIALELFPGDSDTRLNLQLTGNHLIDAPDVLDRDKMASFNGTLDMPFGNNNWLARMRFNVGLDMSDLYFNPELTYTGLSNQEIYLELHEYNGDTGSIGGFYKHNSLVNLGWRITL